MLLKKVKDDAKSTGKATDPKLIEFGHIVRSLIPRLNETIIEILSEEPFQGTGMLMTEGGAIRFSSEKIIVSLTGFALRLLGGKVEPEHKISLACRVDGIDPNEAIRVGDLLTIDVNCERLIHETAAQTEGGTDRLGNRLFMGLVNFATEQMVIEEVNMDEKVKERSFKMMLRQRGRNKFRAYVFRGDGQIDSSFNKDVSVF